MINEEITVKYQGSIADQHMLPALEAGISIQGISRSITITTNYLATGKIRRQAPFLSDIDVYIKPLRAGSLDTIYQIVSTIDPVIVAGQVAIGVTGSLVYGVLGSVFRRVTGQNDLKASKDLEQLESVKGGDISALEDAIEPALVQAHRVIGYGSNNIVIFGNGNNVVFDKSTKEYITTSYTETKSNTKRVSIASYNANDKTGRLYDPEFHKTVPFSIVKNAKQSTAVSVARSLTRYAASQDSNLEIVYRKVLAPDNRIKRYLISNAKIVGDKSPVG